MMGLCAKTKKKKKKKQRNSYIENLNLKIQWMQFPNLFAWNNPKQVEMPLKSISEISSNVCVVFHPKLILTSICKDVLPPLHNHIYQPLCSGTIWHKVNFFKQSLKGLNSEFSFS